MSGIAKYSIKTLIDLTNEEKDDEWPVTQVTPYKVISNINRIKEPPHSIKPSPHSTKKPPHSHRKKMEAAREAARVAELKKEVGKSLTKNDVASVVDWMDVSSSEDDWTIHEGDMYEPRYDLPRGWKCIEKEDKDGRCVYSYPEFAIKVRGCKNMFLADSKIRKWKKKYKKKVKCPHCKQTPCCLEAGMGDLLRDHAAECTSGRHLNNNEVRYCLYRCAARSFFGYLGWKKRKKFPQCIVEHIRYLYPNNNNINYTNLFALITSMM